MSDDTTEMKEAPDKIDQAVEVLFDGAHTDGEHHKQWAIVEALKILLGSRFYETIGRNTVENGYFYEGIAP